MAIDRSKALYRTSEPASGGLPGLTKDRAEGEAAERLDQTKRMAEKKEADMKIRSKMTSEVGQLVSPPSLEKEVSRALGMVSRKK